MNRPVYNRLVSIAEAAEYAHVHHQTVRRRIADGSLPATRLGPRLIRVDLNDIDALMRPIGGGAA